LAGDVRWLGRSRISMGSVDGSLVGVRHTYRTGTGDSAHSTRDDNHGQQEASRYNCPMFICGPPFEIGIERSPVLRTSAKEWPT
jgi:hypothetical protein